MKMTSYYPKTTDPCGKSFYGTIISNQDEHQGLARVDYQLNSNQSLFLRYFISHSLQPTPLRRRESAVHDAVWSR